MGDEGGDLNETVLDVISREFVFEILLEYLLVQSVQFGLRSSVHGIRHELSQMLRGFVVNLQAELIGLYSFALLSLHWISAVIHAIFLLISVLGKVLGFNAEGFTGCIDNYIAKSDVRQTKIKERGLG